MRRSVEHLRRPVVAAVQEREREGCGLTRSGCRLGLPLSLAELQVVDAADVHEHLEFELGGITQQRGHAQQPLGWYLVGELTGVRR